jgi:hypothetical protein
LSKSITCCLLYCSMTITNLLCQADAEALASAGFIFGPVMCAVGGAGHQAPGRAAEAEDVEGDDVRAGQLPALLSGRRTSSAAFSSVAVITAPLPPNPRRSE